MKCNSCPWRGNHRIVVRLQFFRVVQCLDKRAHSLCHISKLEKELDQLRGTFLANGYPKQIIERNLISHKDKCSNTTTGEDNKPNYLLMPYVKGISEKIERVCRPLNIKAIFKTTNTLRNHLMHVKQPRPMSKEKGVVYEIPCLDCNSKYIGETGRILEKRIKEHQYTVKRKDEKNGISVHAWNNSHRVNWSKARVVQIVKDYYPRRVKRPSPYSFNLKPPI